MKLWLCYATTTDTDVYGVKVASTEEEVKEKFSKELDETGIWYASVYADEVKEIDGYVIDVRYKVTEQDMFDSMG